MDQLGESCMMRIGRLMSDFLPGPQTSFWEAEDIWLLSLFFHAFLVWSSLGCGFPFSWGGLVKRPVISIRIIFFGFPWCSLVFCFSITCAAFRLAGEVVPPAASKGKGKGNQKDQEAGWMQPRLGGCDKSGKDYRPHHHHYRMVLHSLLWNQLVSTQRYP